MLQGKKAYICSPLSAPNPEGMQHNMELAKYYLMQMKRLYHCRTFASHAHLPLMLDDRIPEERETAMQIGALMLDLCEVCDYRYICGGKCMASEGEYDRKCIFAKAMFKYVLFYYKQQDKNREKLENYVQYLEKIKKCMGER